MYRRKYCIIVTQVLQTASYMNIISHIELGTQECHWWYFDHKIWPNTKHEYELVSATYANFLLNLMIFDNTRSSNKRNQGLYIHQMLTFTSIGMTRRAFPLKSTSTLTGRSTWTFEIYPSSTIKESSLLLMPPLLNPFNLFLSSAFASTLYFWCKRQHRNRIG